MYTLLSGQCRPGLQELDLIRNLLVGGVEPLVGKGDRWIGWEAKGGGWFTVRYTTVLSVGHVCPSPCNGSSTVRLFATDCNAFLADRLTPDWVIVIRLAPPARCTRGTWAGCNRVL